MQHSELPSPYSLLAVAENGDRIELGQSIDLQALVTELSIGSRLHKEYVLNAQLFAPLRLLHVSLLLGSVAFQFVREQLDVNYVLLPIARRCARLIEELLRFGIDQQRLNGQHFTWGFWI